MAEKINNNGIIVEQKSDRELVTTRSFNAPARLVFQAWTTPELLQRWWAPKSMGMNLASCDVDARSGGTYRFAFAKDGKEIFVAFGKYLEATLNKRLVWTNEEDANGPVTSLTFEEKDGKTLLTMSELHPSKEALDQAMGGIMPEQFVQLDELLATM